ncbi:D-inositol 3-phosphate glycosyltransferase [Rubripirellula tenax]|uniref:D-inositol 3-phosphate glycosyltransferase n=1 Tax=Rubripirellula tenax TaxID=2528015 RepID=A0A5C6EG92_9BACT|nr:glycosyltransferase family 4 protein [Rubripirellula tenax]TWU47590.1 D-inositol 3-phosphate glycosyltransferase [Rubripirellula tenax]
MLSHTNPAPVDSASLAPAGLSPVTVNPVIVIPATKPPGLTPSIDLKVLHVVNGEHFSGAERVQSHLGRCLPKFGIGAGFACVKPGKFAAMLKEPGSDWGDGHDASMTNRFDLRAAARVRELVIAHGYELLHAHTPRTAMITSIAARMTGLPWIYHVHSPASRDSSNAMANRVNAWIERQALRSCSHLITVSESLRMDCIRKGVAEEKVTVVHNGVPAVRPPRTVFPTVGGRWTIGMIALMRPRKGLEVAIDALAKLKERGHDVTLRVIGPFETTVYEAGIQSQIDALEIQDRIERFGFTKDVPAALAELDAMVLPSLFGEGLPMVVLEAMAAAVPVIATRVEGTPEAVTHGVEGLLAEPQDPESLADAIEELVTGRQDWHRMSESAFQTHAQKFSDLAMASGAAEVYRRLLNHIL